MRSIPLRIEVGQAIGSDIPLQVAGTAYLPDAPLSPRPIVIFASPGGGYSQHYYNMHFEGHEGYSEAEHHTARGIVFVAMDHLGVGESSLELKDSARVEDIADGNDAFVRAVVEKLKAGSLSTDFPALERPFVVGIGQSMGGGITMIMQGRKATFDAIAPLGISALHTTLPQPTPEQYKACRDIFMFSRRTPLDKLSVRVTSEHVPDFIYPFHMEDVPKDILDADMAGGYPLRQNPPIFGSATTPACAVAMNSPGFFTEDVIHIRCPVLLAYGERDVSADMRREATAFINSDDVSIFIVPKMAHMHNFATTRQLLWQRVADWTKMQSRRLPVPA